ncbi:MAG: hypothetical protein ACKO3H_03570, partial [Verrucomicrobiota bacterium]
SATDGTLTAHIQIMWAAAPGATGYQVLRAVGISAPLQIGTTATVSFNDTTATPGITYVYTVRATGLAQGSLSAPSIADTGFRPLAAPSVTASDGTSTAHVTLTWPAAPGATSYRIFRDGSVTPLAVATSTTFNDTTAIPGVSYSYAVRAVATTITGDLGASDTGHRQLAEPTGTSASDGTSTTHVSILWSGVTGASQYQVLRQQGSSPATAVGTAAAPPFLDTSAAPGIPYTYTVRATTSVATSASGPGDAGYRQLSMPTSVTATDGTVAAQVQVTWPAVAGATGYQVLRALGSVAPTLLGTASANSFNDTTAVPGTSYAYSVRAVGLAQGSLSAPSIADTGFRPLGAPSVTASDGTSTEQVTLTWPAVPGAASYQVFRDGSASPMASSTLTTLADTNAIPGVLHAYAVRAVTTTVTGTLGASDTGYRQLSPPGSITASDGEFTDRVRVTWTVSKGASSYQIFRSDAPTVPLATVSGSTTFDDTTIPVGPPRGYSVKARTAVTASAMSISDTGYRGLPAPGGVAASDGSSEANVTVRWGSVTGAIGYRVYRTQGRQAPLLLAQVAVSTLVFIDTTAAPGEGYLYTVAALSTAGPGAIGGPDPGYRQVAAPTGVTASDGTSTERVSVGWIAVTGASGYQVFRQQGASAPIPVGTTTEPTVLFLDSSAVPGVSYTYTVRATTQAGTGPEGKGDSGYRQVSAPTGVSATDGTSSAHVLVTWVASPGASGYQVFRSGTPAAIGVLNGSATSFFDTTVPVGTRFSYTVKTTGATAGSLSAASAPDSGWRNQEGPRGVSASDDERTRVRVKWLPMTGTPTITGYLV